MEHKALFIIQNLIYKQVSKRGKLNKKMHHLSYIHIIRFLIYTSHSSTLYK